MARTWAIWPGTARPVRCWPSAVRSISVTPARRLTAGSTSGGIPRSSMNSGRPPACARAAATRATGSTGTVAPVAPVAVTRMSAPASAAGTSLVRRGLPCRVAAGHAKPPGAGLAEQPGREPARGPGPEHHRIAARQAAQVRVGEVQAGPGERDTFGADRGLGAGPLADPQRRVDQAGDGGAGGARRHG